MDSKSAELNMSEAIRLLRIQDIGRKYSEGQIDREELNRQLIAAGIEEEEWEKLMKILEVEA